MTTLIRYKGIGDVLVALILSIKPQWIYDSLPARLIAHYSGLHLSRAETAPGFNQAIACMVAAVGVAHVVASYCGPAARPPILAMNATWAVLGLLTCATPIAWNLGSATLLMSSLNHLAFSAALFMSHGFGLPTGRKKR